MIAATELEPRIARAEGILDEYLKNEAWDNLAGMHDVTLPAVGDPGRLSAIRNDLRPFFDFRSIFGGIERWQVPIDESGGWDKRLQLPGITNPKSAVSRESMRAMAKLGLIKLSELPEQWAEGIKPIQSFELRENVDPQLIGALGCAGVLLAQRVQKQWGYKITKVDAAGNFSFECIPDTQAHPALQDPHKLRFTTSSFRPLKREPQFRQSSTVRSEVDEVRGFAEGAETEFDLSVTATRLALGSRAKQRSIELDDPGYPFEGRKGVIVVHEVNGEPRAIDIGVPLPAQGWRERDRAQTPHTYSALQNASDIVVPGLLVPNTSVAAITSGSYGGFQYIALENHCIEPGWNPHVATVANQETGLDRVALQPQLLTRMEVFSLADQLTHLDNHIQRLRSNIN